MKLAEPSRTPWVRRCFRRTCGRSLSGAQVCQPDRPLSIPRWGASFNDVLKMKTSDLWINGSHGEALVPLGYLTKLMPARELWRFPVEA